VTVSCPVVLVGVGAKRQARISSVWPATALYSKDACTCAVVVASGRLILGVVFV
jgi:hypothetical protein